MDCGIRWAEACTSSVILARWHKCALIAGYLGATWRIRLNDPSAAAMQPYDKLLRPLVNFKVNYWLLIHNSVCCFESQHDKCIQKYLFSILAVRAATCRRCGCCFYKLTCRTHEQYVMMDKSLQTVHKHVCEEHLPYTITLTFTLTQVLSGVYVFCISPNCCFK